MNRFAAPTWIGAHPLGTDELGRDVLTRVIYGGRPALGVSGVAAVLATLIGVALALLAALGGRTWDGVLGLIADVQLAIPSILLALVVLGFVGNGFVPLVAVFTVGALALSSGSCACTPRRSVTLPRTSKRRGPASQHLGPAAPGTCCPRPCSC